MMNKINLNALIEQLKRCRDNFVVSFWPKTEAEKQNRAAKNELTAIINRLISIKLKTQI